MTRNSHGNGGGGRPKDCKLALAMLLADEAWENWVLERDRLAEELSSKCNQILDEVEGEVERAFATKH